MRLPVAETEMLIRASPSDVFSAFVEPHLLEQFWLKRASAPLALHARVEWEFMVPGAIDTVTVAAFIDGELLSWRWSDGGSVTLRFSPQDENGTRVSVTTSAFDGEHALAQAIDSTQGFTIVLCDLKCLLETGRSGNMVRDKAALIVADAAGD